MGLLEKLWDDTVAGPRPESGLGKLRKYNTFSFRSISGKDQEGGSYGEEEPDKPEGVKVTRSITIVKPAGYNGSAPVSPAGSISPGGPFSPSSPFSGNRSGGFRFRRRSTSDTYDQKTANEDGVGSLPPSQDV